MYATYNIIIMINAKKMSEIIRTWMWKSMKSIIIEDTKTSETINSSQIAKLVKIV